KKGPDPLGMEKAALAEASSESGPKSQNVDPFDLALPGELTRTDAPSVSATYGADGSPVSSIDVFAAFLRKFPGAAKNEPTWEQLAPGSAERIVFTVTLENGERGLTLTIDE